MVVGDSLGLDSVVDSSGTPISVVDSCTLVGKLEDVSYDGVAMNGSVVRNV